MVCRRRRPHSPGATRNRQQARRGQCQEQAQGPTTTQNRRSTTTTTRIQKSTASTHPVATATPTTRATLATTTTPTTTAAVLKVHQAAMLAPCLADCKPSYQWVCVCVLCVDVGPVAPVLHRTNVPKAKAGPPMRLSRASKVAFFACCFGLHFKPSRRRFSLAPGHSGAAPYIEPCESRASGSEHSTAIGEDHQFSRSVFFRI